MKNNRLKPGGLALVIGFSTNPQNVGKIVTLQSFQADTHFDDGQVLDVWKCTGDSLVWPDGRPLDFGFFEPKNLMPLGDEDYQKKLAKEVESI